MAKKIVVTTATFAIFLTFMAFQNPYVTADLDDFADIKCTSEIEESEEFYEVSALRSLTSAELTVLACAICEVSERQK